MGSLVPRMTQTASTKRPPAITNNKRGLPATHLSSFPCTPIYPIDARTQQRLILGSPFEAQQVFTEGDLDIHKGDVLIVPASSGREYPIRFVERWEKRTGVVLQIIIEKVGA